MSSPQSRWEAVLSLMEQRLETAARWLDGEAVDAGHFALPADIGPMPPALASRASRVLEATARVEQRLQAEMAATESRLRVGAAAGGRPAERPAPSYVDCSA